VYPTITSSLSQAEANIAGRPAGSRLITSSDGMHVTRMKAHAMLTPLKFTSRTVPNRNAPRQKS
jgi:hypothetical protein